MKFECNCKSEKDFRQMVVAVHAADEGFNFEVGARCWLTADGFDKAVMVEYQITTQTAQNMFGDDDLEGDWVTAYLVENENDMDVSHELDSACIDRDISLADVKKEMLGFAEDVMKEVLKKQNSKSVESKRVAQDSKEFNPFYDSDFLISREGFDGQRMLVELYDEELVQLRNEIDAVLKIREPRQEHSVDGLISQAAAISKQSKGLAEDLSKYRDELNKE